MRHYSCDLCGKTLAAGEEPRFVVRVDGFPAADPIEPTDVEDADTDTDSVEQMDELLAEMEIADPEHETVEMLPVASRREYDLCGGCYGKLLSDPLGLESRRTLPVSRN